MLATIASPTRRCRSGSIFGKRIVVTRTRQQASGLAKGLARLGADVIEIPTIRIVPVALDEAKREKFADFSKHYDWLVFTSPKGVALFFDEFFQRQEDVRSLGSVKIAAVGPATAKGLSDLHLKIDLQPEIYTTEKLAECFTLKDAAAMRFCLPHGNLADPWLAGHLREQGALVDEWLLYRTEPETDDSTGARARFLREGAHWITFTSSSTAENWHALKLQPAAAKPEPKAVSHSRTAAISTKRGSCRSHCCNRNATARAWLKWSAAMRMLQGRIGNSGRKRWPKKPR